MFNPLQCLIVVGLVLGVYVDVVLLIVPVFGWSVLSVLHLFVLLPTIAILIVAFYRATFTDPGHPRDLIQTRSEVVDTPASIELEPLVSSSQTILNVSAVNVAPAFERDSMPTYCSVCDCSKPPRTHHCSTCRRCVLRMDHHCVWLGQCVGLNNYKYFISFLVWMILACCYSLYLFAVRIVFMYFIATPSVSEASTLSTLHFCLATLMFALLVLGTSMGMSLLQTHNALMAFNMTTIEALQRNREFPTQSPPTSFTQPINMSDVDIFGSSLELVGDLGAHPHRYDLGDALTNLKEFLGNRQSRWFLPVPLADDERNEGRSYPIRAQSA